MHLDHAVPQALAHLLGPDWQVKLQRTVTRVMKGHKLRPRAWTEEQAEAHRKRMADLALGKTPWTPAKLELLRRDFPTRPLPKLWEALNEMPGPHVASPEAMRKKAEQLGLKRDPLVTSAERSANMRRIIAERNAPKVAPALPAAPEPEPPPPAAEARQPEPPPQPAPRAIVPSLDDWTAEGELTPEAERDTPATIKPALNVPPAAPPRSTQRVTTPWIEEAMEGKRPIAPVAATLDAWVSPGVLTPEAEADAQRMLAEGQGAKAMHEEFGGRLEWWQSWTARHRQAGRAA